MDRTSGLGFVVDANGHRVFTDQDLVAGVDGTDVEQVWLTGVQEEVVGVIEAAGLVANEADNAQLLKAISLIGRRQQLLTGTAIFSVPAGVYGLEVEIWGAGGSGGTSAYPGYPGGGGGAGGYTKGYLPVMPGQQIPYSQGLGAVASAGGDTTFGALKATGGTVGAPGSSSNVGAGGTPGVGSGGTDNRSGGGGSAAVYFGSSAGSVEGGRGGAAQFGAGHSFASGGSTTGFNANAGNEPGGGASGCTLNTAAGGNGRIFVKY